MSSPGESLVLTTHRVRYHLKGSGGEQLQSIMLKEVASCAMQSKSRPLFLVLMGLSVLVGFYFSGVNSDINFLYGGVVAGLIFLMIYLGSRQRILVISSAGAAIIAPLAGWKSEGVLGFIDELEVWKDKRFHSR